ncbi:MAG TPA: hypothetical protein VFG28_09060 [Syntrophales bacterium]|nr:hypothetical protein [Syntrophales bacterium]
MKRFRIACMLIVALVILIPGSAFAEWKVYYTGKAAKMFGSYGRGNFGTRSQCEAYRSSSAGFERNNSYCSGSDSASSKPSAQKSPGASNGSTEQSRQLQLQREQEEKEKELARQQKFDQEKEQLLSGLKGTDGTTGALELKTPQAGGDRQPATVDPKILQEQDEFANRNADWMKKQKQLIEQRLMEPNKYASAIYQSLKTNAPPPPWKKYDELQPGDVLLIEGSGIAAVDNKFSSGGNASNASHTVIYLKEVNGKRLFLDNQPFEGPRIISEDEFLKRYGSRGAEVAKLAQPLNEKEGKQLFTAAVEMAQKNRKKITDNWFGTPLLETNYGAWGKENVVCSEADWALLRATGRNIPKSGDRIKVGLGIDFSPADYKNSQYFLVTPLW